MNAVSTTTTFYSLTSAEALLVFELVAQKYETFTADHFWEEAEILFGNVRKTSGLGGWGQVACRRGICENTMEEERTRSKTRVGYVSVWRSLIFEGARKPLASVAVCPGSVRRCVDAGGVK